jgi:hypothetical protein
MKSPIDSAKMESIESMRDLTTIKKQVSPEILGGRLTIKSINNIESSF